MRLSAQVRSFRQVYSTTRAIAPWVCDLRRKWHLVRCIIVCLVFGSPEKESWRRADAAQVAMLLFIEKGHAEVRGNHKPPR